MTLLRALYAEVLKLKRTIALIMVVLAPSVVALLILFMTSQAPFSFVHPGTVRDEWMHLTHVNLRFWALLVMPLFITLETALVAGLDHSENHWKSLLARPVPRWTMYVAKLLVVLAMTVAATLLLLCGILLDGAILPRLQSEIAFGLPVPVGPIFRECAQVMALVFLALTIQHWVSLRWRSFSVAIGTGIVALTASFFAVAAARQIGGWPQYFPWALPMMIFAEPPHNIETGLAISSGFGLAVAAAGCLDFCRREVQ